MESFINLGMQFHISKLVYEAVCKLLCEKDQAGKAQTVKDIDSDGQSRIRI